MSESWLEGMAEEESPFAETAEMEMEGWSESPFSETGMEMEGWSESPFAGTEMETEGWSESPFAETEMETEGWSSEAGYGEGEGWSEAGYGEAEGWLESLPGESWSETPVMEHQVGTRPGAPRPAQAAPVTGAPTGCFQDRPYPRDRRPWRFGKKTTRPGVADVEDAYRAEVQLVHLSDFDVDRYELKANHHDALHRLVKMLVVRIRAMPPGKQAVVRVIGQTSSTASTEHNVRLARHRAHNVAAALECLLQQEGVSSRVHLGFLASGEEFANRALGDRVESAPRRTVIIDTVVPVRVEACPPAKPCPECQGTPRPRPTAQTTQLCVSVPRIQSRSGGSTPAVVPLGSFVTGLALPVGIVPHARAEVRVQDRAAGRAGTYQLTGWGLEVALPVAGGARVDIRASLRASLEAVARAAGSLGVRFRAGPMGLSLRVDAAAFSRLLVNLTADLRARIEVAFGPGSQPDPTGCALVPASARAGSVDLRSLAGPATLIVPGRALGAAQLRFQAPAITTGAVRLGRNPVAVPADKSTVRTLLVIQGALRMLDVKPSAREFEVPETFQLGPEAEWEALTEPTEAELVPFA